MSSSYVLSPLAQTDAYVLAIHEACEVLVKAMANGQLAGQSAEHIRAGYRKQIVGSHLIFSRAN